SAGDDGAAMAWGAATPAARAAATARAMSAGVWTVDFMGSPFDLDGNGRPWPTPETGILAQERRRTLPQSGRGVSRRRVGGRPRGPVRTRAPAPKRGPGAHRCGPAGWDV